MEKTGHEDLGLKARIAKGKKFESLRLLIRAKYVSRKTETRIYYRTIIRPTVTMKKTGYIDVRKMGKENA